MRITRAWYENGALHLECPAREGMAAVFRVKAGKDYDLTEHKEKRSLSANAYAWVLIDRIAERLRLDPLEVYRKAVSETAGTVAETICIREIAAPAFIRSWEEGHLGRQCRMRDSDAPGFVEIDCIYGSSDFDRAQMARLIDALVQDARALEIETKPQEYIDSLLSSWRA